MDTIEATKTVMSRIQTIDPENASKIMGYVLIQDQGEHEMIRLAFGPETLLTSVINQAKAFLNISSNTSSAPSSPSPFPPRVLIPNNGYDHMTPHSPWSPSFQVPSTRGDSILLPYLNSPTDWAADELMHQHHCMYSGRGFCKNGDGGFGDEVCSGVDGFEDFMRMKAMQQRVAVMAAAGGGPCSFSSRSPPSAAAALMMGEEFHKLGLFRPDIAALGLESSTSCSRQIYLTFPADSTFKQEDVSNYFSIFGPVQDVRIPYQQKRMFGFVTFVFPETVKSILAKGNPHFICDSRVLVKPYKEKGTIPIKRHRHQIERGDFSALESAEPFDHIPFGARMFKQDMMLRRHIEDQDEFQQTIDFQERKLMNMRLTVDHQLQHGLSDYQTNNGLVYGNNLSVHGEENKSSDTQQPLTEVPQEVTDDDRKESSDFNNHKSNFEHDLPDNLFADAGASDNTNQIALNTASLKSCYFQMPRKLKEPDSVAV